MGKGVSFLPTAFQRSKVSISPQGVLTANLSQICPKLVPPAPEEFLISQELDMANAICDIPKLSATYFQPATCASKGKKMFLVRGQITPPWGV